MPLEMRNRCEHCETPLEADEHAFICSFECTFCPRCTGELASVCPNCAGELTCRPRRGPKPSAPAADAVRHTAHVQWQRAGADFPGRRYSRVHTWQLDGGLTLRASASPHIVEAPYSDAAAIDPEEAFIAALASCHMLWFLDFAAQAGITIDAYQDQAKGMMLRSAHGQRALGYIVLEPHITTCSSVSNELLIALHERAHEACFLANTLRYPVQLRPTHAERAAALT